MPGPVRGLRFETALPPDAAGGLPVGATEDASRFQTRRRRMRDLLASREDGFTLLEIEEIFDVSRARAIEDLRHLHKSLRRGRDNLLMVPPRCGECGFVFAAEEPKAPSKCPVCRSKRVADPVFKVGKAEA